MMASGLHPIIALSKSGLSADPLNNYEVSKGYMRLRWGDPEEPAPEPTTEIVEEDHDTDGLGDVL